MSSFSVERSYLGEGERMEIVITANDAKDWIYKGEGAANIILSYQGSSPLLVGKVLRIQKIPKDETEQPSAYGQLSLLEQLIWGSVAELIKTNNGLAQKYATCIMGPLLGIDRIDAAVCVSVSREFLEEMEDSTLHFQPAWRIKASKIDILSKSHFSSQTILYFQVTRPSALLLR